MASFLVTPDRIKCKMNTAAADSKCCHLEYFGVNTYSFTLKYTALKTLEVLAAKGFRHFELMMFPGHLWPIGIDGGEIKSLIEYIKANGLKIGTLNMPNVDMNIASAMPEVRATTLKMLRSIIELAGELQVDGVVLGPGKPNPLMPMPKSQMMAYFYSALSELVPLAADCGTSIFVENMPFAFLPRIAELVKSVEQFGDDRVGIVYDVANGYFVGEDPEEALRVCAPRLRVVHLSDTTRTVYTHSSVGLGSVDFEGVSRGLSRIGYSGPLVLEIISDAGVGAIIDSARSLHGLK